MYDNNEDFWSKKWKNDAERGAKKERRIFDALAIGSGALAGAGIARESLKQRKKRGLHNSRLRKVLTYGGSGLAGAGTNLAITRLADKLVKKYRK